MGERHHTGQVALITGGGRGFGKAFGHALAEAGAHVVLADIDESAVADAVAEIEAAGGKASPAICDIADEIQVEKMMADIEAKFGGLDILINNAGLHSAAYNKSMADLGLEKIRRLFDVNVMGVILCTMAARRLMENRSGAAIVNISSCAAYAVRTAYGVSKLAVQGLTISFARELSSLGIRVNGISPGVIFTDTIRKELSADLVADLMRQQILSREGEERDIVEAVLYLVSSKASFITGETLRVSGGFALSM